MPPPKTDQAPASTPSAQRSAQSDKIQAIRESSSEITKTFDKYERLQAEAAVKNLQVLPSTANLDEARAAALENSTIAKELRREKEKQDRELDSIAQDLNGWQTRVQEKGALSSNETARDLMQTALTAAIELLMENPKYLTNTHRENLASLGVMIDDGRLSAANSSLESIRTTLGLDVGAEDSAVQENLSNLRGHEATVVLAREKINISQDDGDILAAIDKLKSDLSTANSTASTRKVLGINNKTGRDVIGDI